eukprot:4152187-Pleurochrysis_carterae.AAC.1
MTVCAAQDGACALRRRASSASRRVALGTNRASPRPAWRRVRCVRSTCDSSRPIGAFLFWLL